MAFISFLEVIYLIVLTFVIGYIFSGYIKRPRTELDILDQYKNRYFNWEDIKLAIIVAAPAVVLHELGHKFVAIFFGLNAVLKIFFEGLGLAIFLKLINSPFLIVAPAYVSISGNATEFQSMITAFSGPFINLILFLIAYILLNRAKLTKNQALILYLTKQINLLLFIFNMLPIPPLDGSKVFYNLFKIIF
jgi:Zn-dependent protease